MKFVTYLYFDGNTEEAFKFYKSVFGGEFKALIRFKDVPMQGVNLQKADENKLMHIAFPLGTGDMLMASDVLKSRGHKVIKGNNVGISKCRSLTYPGATTTAVLRKNSESGGWWITFILKRNKSLLVIE